MNAGRKMTVGVFLPNWVGDLAMATPALRALRRHVGGSARIVGIVRPAVAATLADTPFLDELWHYDAFAEDRRAQAWRLVGRLRRARVETVLLLTNTRRSALIAWASGARRRIGDARNRRSWFLTDRVEAPRADGRFVPRSAVTSYLRLAEALGCPSDPSPRIELATSAADERACDEAFAALGIDDGDDVVVLNSSSAFGPAKLWPAEYFGTLGRRIASELGHAVVVLCGPAERDVVATIVRAAAHPRVRSLAEQPIAPSLGLSKAAVRRARLLVTTDSGPRHFAAAFDVPVVTLFGPTAIAWSETWFAKAVHLQHAVDCGPCQQRRCPLEHHRCMRELDVDRVFAAVSAQLARWPRTRARDVAVSR